MHFALVATRYRRGLGNAGRTRARIGSTPDRRSGPVRAFPNRKSPNLPEFQILTAPSYYLLYPVRGQLKTNLVEEGGEWRTENECLRPITDPRQPMDWMLPPLAAGFSLSRALRSTCPSQKRGPRVEPQRS